VLQRDDGPVEGRVIGLLVLLLGVGVGTRLSGRNANQAVIAALTDIWATFG